jgi:hypothetical protein
MTGHKAFRTQMLKEIPLHSDSFEIEVELVMKAVRRDARVSEVPISYSYRKRGTAKVGWKHGISSFIMIPRSGLSELPRLIW